MWVGLLGPLLIEAGGMVIDLGAASRRAFIYLTLHAEQVVTADRLAQVVWTDTPTPDVEHALHSLVYRLRQQLTGAGTDGAAIVRRAPGYVLEISRSEIDVPVFEQRLDDAYVSMDDDPAAARAGFARAHELWRGEPLLDVAHEPWALPESRRVCERYVASLEAMARCDVALGNLERAVAELTALTATYPLRESLWTLLWQSLARAGRYAEVVQSHRRCTRILQEEYGIGPLDHLDALARDLVHAGGA